MGLKHALKSLGDSLNRWLSTPNLRPSFPANILLVAEESKNFWNLIAPLEEKGWNVVTAHSGEEALGLMEKESPNVVIADYIFWNVPGSEFAERIRQTPEKSGTDLIVICPNWKTYKAEIDFKRTGSADYVDYVQFECELIKPAKIIFYIQVILRVRKGLVKSRCEHYG